MSDRGVFIHSQPAYHPDTGRVSVRGGGDGEESIVGRGEGGWGKRFWMHDGSEKNK